MCSRFQKELCSIMGGWCGSCPSELCTHVTGGGYVSRVNTVGQDEAAHTSEAKSTWKKQRPLGGWSARPATEDRPVVHALHSDANGTRRANVGSSGDSP